MRDGEAFLPNGIASRDLNAGEAERRRRQVQAEAMAGIYQSEMRQGEGCPARFWVHGNILDIMMHHAVFDGVLTVVRETFFFMSPLTGEWAAPPHPYLLPDRGEPKEGWMRKGPGAITRAWCNWEICRTKKEGCKLHIVLGRADVDGFVNFLNSQPSTRQPWSVSTASFK